MKVPLPSQISEAETHRDELEKAVKTRPELMERLHRAEGLVLTLMLLQTHETEFRQYMAARKAR